MIIYTDASKSEKGTGCAYYVPNLNIREKLKLHPDISIFTAEAIAIFEALRFAQNHIAPITVITSDSLSVLASLKNSSDITIKSNPLILKIKILIRNFYLQGRQVHFIWVKSHIGLEGNEHVDSLAKDSVSTGASYEHGLCLSDCLITLRRKFKQKWNSLWHEFCLTSTTQYILLHRDIPSSFWHDNFGVARKYITTIIRMKFGHACYPYHLHKIKVITSNLCDRCNSVGHLDHIFLECSKFSDASNKLYNNLISCGFSPPFNILSLLTMNNKDVFDCIIQFLKDTNIRL